MLEDILSGWKKGYEGLAISTNTSLISIEKHLEKLNGKVAEHERIINQNLPHNVSHCSQVETIRELQDNMITIKALKTYLAGTIAIISGVISAIYIIFDLIKS